MAAMMRESQTARTQNEWCVLSGFLISVVFLRSGMSCSWGDGFRWDGLCPGSGATMSGLLRGGRDQNEGGNRFCGAVLFLGFFFLLLLNQVSSLAWFAVTFRAWAGLEEGCFAEGLGGESCELVKVQRTEISCWIHDGAQ